MSDDSNGVEAKTEDQVEENEEEDMSKCKKLKISNDEAERADSNKNEDTKSKISKALKDASENTKLTVNSGDSLTNNSDLVVSNVDTSTNNSDSASNECGQVESASSNVSNSANSQPQCTDSNPDAQKQSSNNDNTETKQSGSVLQDDNKVNKSDPGSDAIEVENESCECSADLVSDNEKIATTQTNSDDRNGESKTSANSLKNNEETLYELLNNPMDVQDDTSTNANGNTEVSAASNGSTEQTDTAAIKDESQSTEIQKNDEITCKELLDILQEKDKKIEKKVLIIDVRSKEEFCKSRMSFHNNLINISAEKIQPNKVPGYYWYILLHDNEAEKKFSRRSRNDIIVLVDKNSELKTMDSDSKIAIFKHCLEEYDVHIDYKRIAVLKGGFEEWTNLYPNFVTKS